MGSIKHDLLGGRAVVFRGKGRDGAAVLGALGFRRAAICDEDGVLRAGRHAERIEG